MVTIEKHLISQSFITRLVKMSKEAFKICEIQNGISSSTSSKIEVYA